MRRGSEGEEGEVSEVTVTQFTSVQASGRRCSRRPPDASPCPPAGSRRPPPSGPAPPLRSPDGPR